MLKYKMQSLILLSIILVEKHKLKSSAFEKGITKKNFHFDLKFKKIYDKKDNNQKQRKRISI